MMTRSQIQTAMRDRIISVVMEATGLTRPTLMKLRDGLGVVSTSTQIQISNYLEGK